MITAVALRMNGLHPQQPAAQASLYGFVPRRTNRARNPLQTPLAHPTEPIYLPPAHFWLQRFLFFFFFFFFFVTLLRLQLFAMAGREREGMRGLLCHGEGRRLCH
ncbi:hypothetical protein BDZ91DRAFT_355860 [Kalaharituber pfeilii]|nr:hypothetical protein BDZ91DRAFT_355860 [Kalaharituber pfeilii]